jgi:formylglycine-generating enzyme required for sulfatase activity/serine/threonine protein kinase
MGESREPGSAERAYEEYLAQPEDGRDFESFCAERRELADELRRLHELVQRAARALPGSSLSARLAERFGSQADPRVTLREGDGSGDEDEVEPASGFSSEVLGRLGERKGAFGRYVLKGEIDRGGQGAVVRVWDEDLRRALAMKVLLGRSTTPPDERARGDGTPAVEPRSLGRFLEEAQVTGQLDHPGIVPVHELGLDAEGQVYFTMKLVKGRTLKDVLDLVAEEKEGWTQTRALGVLSRVCEAMAYAHHKGVVHRDLKPANVMVGKFGEVYVMDWGLAKVLGREDTKNVAIAPQATTEELYSERRERAEASPDSPLLTMDGEVVGTPAYMPPEQALGRTEAIGPPSDVYALGAVLYHLLAGHMPYAEPGMRLSNYDIWYMVQKGPPAPITERAPGTPAELVAICERAMAREIAERYPDVQALAADLSAYLEHRVVSAYETGAWAEAKKWVQRNKPLAASLAAGVVLLAGGLAASLAFKARADANAGLAAENEKDALAQARLAEDNAAEAAEQARIAQANERQAEENAAEAERQATLAVEQSRIATERAEDVLRLSALQDLEDVLADADALWPPHPENIARYQGWIGRAGSLVAELPRHREKRAELRALALSRSEPERRAERESHPEHARLGELQGEIESRRRALFQRRDGVAAEPPAVDWSAHAPDASGLNAEARPLVDPERSVFGREPLGLVLAQRALELAGAGAELSATVGDTVAWGLFALGRDGDALDAMHAALDAAPEERREEFGGYLAKLEERVAAATTDEALEKAGSELSELEAELLALEARVDERREWRFPAEHGEARWWNAQLTKLIEGLEGLLAEETGLLAPEGISAEHGWSVARRLALAEQLEAGFAEGGQFDVLWQQELLAIREAYPDLELVPQMGLVPIGRDQASGLWEFAHLATGEPAVRGEDGKLVLTEETGVVLVLIPGGTFLMGAQSSDPDGQNYDPQASNDDGPVHEVELSAYFLSKYEMTQGQWERVAGVNPSFYHPPGNLTPSLLHPVEQVSWSQCMEVMERPGLALPSEAQWERGARGGSDTPWWTGADRESLRGKVNLADQTAKRAGAPWGGINDWPDLEDGDVVHTEVGRYAANAFGLHEVAGNVWEWCLDGYDVGFYGRSPNKDPVSPPAGSRSRVNRGGGFNDAASYARSALRVSDPPENRVNYLGLRPARGITP